jgi:hypothetical protein
MDVLLAHAALTLRVAPKIGQALRRASAGRPIRIGFVSSFVRGWAIGDLTVGFGLDHVEPSDIEVTPLDGMPVAIDRRLIAVLRRGATIRGGMGWFGPSFGVVLDHPEDWLDFLDGRPIGA